MLANGHWVDYDEAKCVDDEIEIVAQINGKVRAKMSIPVGMETEALRKLVLENEEVLPWVEGKNIVKFIAVRNIVNIVVK